VTVTLKRKVVRLGEAFEERLRRRWADACARPGASMDPEQARAVRDWLVATTDGKDWRLPCRPEHPQHICPHCVEQHNPPALARAVWFMLLDHTMGAGGPVAMPPHIAAVYLSDPDAYPAYACPGCGYLMPARCRVRPGGFYEYIGWYYGTCPACGQEIKAKDDEATDTRSGVRSGQVTALRP
jgi:hypothetical protein